mgnify:FL=1
MRYRSYESSSPRRVLTYFLYVIGAFWWITTLILGYQFLSENGEKINTKWGTFVEAIFNQVSYLPYLKNDWQSLFYQSFLFDACADYNTINEQGLQGSHCKLNTSDYQTYYISLAGTGNTRSDGQARTLEDIYFTYEKIIHQNIWWIKTLTSYTDLKVEKEKDRIKITFPSSTTDNNYFFTFAILPQHILAQATFEDYTSAFAANPITSGCGKLVPKSSDTQSLIFNLVDCKETNFAFYQIKNYPDFESLSKSILEENSTIVDAYADQVQLPNYERVNVVKSDLLTFFFNTKSPKMKVRLRRALGGLINSKFYVGEEYGKFLRMYKGKLLKKFYSDGSNIQEFINRISLTEKDEGVQQKDLEDSWVQALKKSISIDGVERKFVFYTPKTDTTTNLEIKFSNQFENIKVKDTKGHTFSPKNYKKTDKKISYPLENGKNLNPGQNQYTIVGSIKGKTYTIANIDLYVLATSEKPQEATSDRKIKVVYYNNLESNFAIKQFRKLLENAKILDNFLFEQVSSPEQFEAKIVMEDYDILLTTISMGMKKDVHKVLATDDSLMNPSKYTNPNLTNLFKQYMKNPQQTEIVNQINGIVAQDMPLVIVGHPYNFINIKKNLITPEFSSNTLFEYNRRNRLYTTTTLTQSVELNFKKVKNIREFINYLQGKIWLPPLSIQEEKINPPTSVTGDENKKIPSTPAQEETEKLPEKTSEKIEKTTTSDDPFEGLLSSS